MAIGKVVKYYVGPILARCDTLAHGEIDSLLDRQYSKRAFGLSFPFCREVDDIDPTDSKRRWTDVYVVRGKRVRVTSQWTEKHRSRFVAYLVSNGIATEAEVEERDAMPVREMKLVAGLSNRANARYRGNAIGNAQNAFVRTILSSIGTESFSQKDWEATKAYFAHRCSYCGAETDLVIEHAIPINREGLGEHRLGNLVPSCRSCNDKKGSKDFREFLGDDHEAVSRIETYMDTRNYVPLEDNDQMKMILNMAYAEVASLADRYIAVINSQFAQNGGTELVDEAD